MIRGGDLPSSAPSPRGRPALPAARPRPGTHPDDDPLGPLAPPSRPGRAPTAPAPPPSRSVFASLCTLLLRTQVTRTRVAALVGLGILGILIGLAYGRAPLAENQYFLSAKTASLAYYPTQFVSQVGFSLMIPITALVFASSMFGDPVDDKTLVYLWLRPIRRWQLVLAAALTSFVLTWPLAVPPLVVAAALTGGGRSLVLGSFLAGTVLVAGYVGVFVALGVRVRLPLVWGLFYVVIWELFVAATVPAQASYIALRNYGNSVLQAFTGVTVPPATVGSPLVALTMPLVFGGLALVYATRRLDRQDVA